MHIAISRTDSIGDVIMTLPFTAFLREKFPEAKITFVAEEYTFPVLKATKIIDNIITPNKIDKSITHFFLVFPRLSLAKRIFFLGIPNRISTARRLYNKIFCNKLVRFSRKKSELNEAQLNFFLYKAIDKNFKIPSLPETRKLVKEKVKLTPYVELPEDIKSILRKNKYNIVFHLKSRGSAREYPLSHWEKVINNVSDLSNVSIFFTGTTPEYLSIKNFIDKFIKRNNIYNLMGKLSLSELITFLSEINLLVANSTGPLHIASFLQKDTIGLFPRLKNIDKKRWEPVGKPSMILEADKPCNKCSLKKTGICNCMWNIKPESVINTIYESIHNSSSQ